MKRVLFLALAMGFSGTTLAQAMPVPEADRATTDATPNAVPRNDKALDDLSDHRCLKYTGSRVIRADSKGRKCANATGRAYTRDDLDRTGAVDLADALRRLDPAVH